MPPRSTDIAREAADRRVCTALIRQGSRSFFNASRVLPAAVRDPAYVLYAFCRMADDAVDLVRPAEVPDALAALHRRLDRVYAGCPESDPVERAFARVVERHALPRALPEALLDGFAWDASGRRYDDISAVRAYGARVAGSVGAMMTVLMGVRTPAVVARAVDLGVAMQLTNIARDVAEDWRRSRCYLPVEWTEGLYPGGGPPDRQRVRRGVQTILEVADGYYTAGEAGIAALDADTRLAVRAAARIYHAIGTRIRRRGFEVLEERARVSTLGKLGLFVGAMLTPSDGSRPRPLDDKARRALAAAEQLLREHGVWS